MERFPAILDRQPKNIQYASICEADAAEKLREAPEMTGRDPRYLEGRDSSPGGGNTLDSATPVQIESGTKASVDFHLNLEKNGSSEGRLHVILLLTA